MMIWLFYSLWNVEDESQQQGAVKPKQNSQQPGTENDQNAGAMGATSQSPIDTTNAQQSQDLVNNSQQHQMVNWNECEIIRVKMVSNHLKLLLSVFFSHFPFPARVATTRKSALSTAGAKDCQRIDDTDISVGHRFNAQIQPKWPKFEATTTATEQ